MKTLLYIGAELDTEPISQHSEFNNFIYTIDRPFDDLNDDIIDEFISKMKSIGYKVILRQISYKHPFYIVCHKNNKIVKYHFNVGIPTSYMLKYDTIDEVKINPKYDPKHVLETLNMYQS
jgi:hypothetical protein